MSGEDWVGHTLLPPSHNWFTIFLKLQCPKEKKSNFFKSIHKSRLFECSLQERRLKEAVNIYQLIRGHKALLERPFAMIVLSVEIIMLNFFCWKHCCWESIVLLWIKRRKYYCGKREMWTVGVLRIYRGSAHLFYWLHLTHQQMSGKSGLSGNK